MLQGTGDRSARGSGSDRERMQGFSRLVFTVENSQWSGQCLQKG